MSFPNRADREKCWDSRDKYWECLDKHNIEDAVKDGPCVEFRKVYELSCSAQWVKHFDRRRSYLQFKEKIEKDGYAPLDSPKVPTMPVVHPKTFKKRRVYTEIAY